MTDHDILNIAEKHSDAFRSPTSKYTGDEVFILTPEELINFAREIRSQSMREVE